MSSIYKNTVLNIASQILIMGIMFVAVPFIVGGLGTTDFSILSLTWTVIGYFALWDLGIGTAVTKFVAERSAAGKNEEVSAIIYQSVTMSFALGIIFGIILMCFAGDLTSWLFTVPGAYRSSILTSLEIVALSMPVLILQGALRGALMGFSRFDLKNLLQILNSVLQWGGALLLVLLKYDVVFVIGFVLLTRILTTVLHFVFLWRIVDLKSAVRIRDRKLMRSILGFGGWTMVTQVVAPVLQYTERFMLSAVVATSVVAYYVVPYEATSKLLVLSMGLASVLFPAFSELQITVGTTNELGVLYRRSVRIMCFAFIPMGVLLAGFAPEILRLWMGVNFASYSITAFQILAVAFVVNSIGLMPFTYLLATGHPDITGKVHLSELPFHVAATYVLVSAFGVVGAAVATLVRVVIDVSVLYYFSLRKMADTFVRVPSSLGDMSLTTLIAGLGAAGIFAAADNEILKLLTSLVWLSLYVFIVLRFVLEKEEIQSVSRLVPWGFGTWLLKHYGVS